MAEDAPTPLEVISVALRRERDQARLSLTELAKRAGVAKSTLSQLESGSGNPSIETLWALAVALGVPFSRLVDPPSPHLRVVRADEAPIIRSQQSSFGAALLSSCPPGARRDLHLIDVELGEARHADPHNPGAVEHVVVNAGKLRTGPERSPVELGSGDYASFAGDVAHLYEGLESGTTAVLVMEHI